MNPKWHLNILWLCHYGNNIYNPFHCGIYSQNWYIHCTIVYNNFSKAKYKMIHRCTFIQVHIACVLAMICAHHRRVWKICNTCYVSVRSSVTPKFRMTPSDRNQGGKHKDRQWKLCGKTLIFFWNVTTYDSGGEIR